MDPAIISHLQQKNLHSMVQCLATHSLRLFKNIERWSDLNSRSCVYSSIIVMINYSKLQNITSPLGLNKDLPRAAPGTRLQSLSGLRRRVQKRHWNYTAQGSGLGLGLGTRKTLFSLQQQCSDLIPRFMQIQYSPVPANIQTLYIYIYIYVVCRSIILSSVAPECLLIHLHCPHPPLTRCPHCPPNTRRQLVFEKLLLDCWMCPSETEVCISISCYFIMLRQLHDLLLHADCSS